MLAYLVRHRKLYLLILNFACRLLYKRLLLFHHNLQKMSSLYSDDNIFDLLRDERGDVDVAKLVSKDEALAKKKKKERERLENLPVRNGNTFYYGDLATNKNVVVMYSHETDEQEEKRKVDYFDDNREIDGKIVAQEKVEPRKEKEKNGELVKDLENKRRDLDRKKKVKNHMPDLNGKEEAGISAETEKRDADNKRPVEKKKFKKGNKKREEEEVKGSTGELKGLLQVLHMAVAVVVFMTLGAVMYSTWKEL